MAELWDVLDATGTKTGRTVVRGHRFGAGEYHMTVHVWIRDRSGQYLIQQRSAEVENGAGVWTPTLGHVLAGETSVSTALRETWEEVGIQLLPDQLVRIHRMITGHVIQDVYLAEVGTDSCGDLDLGPEVSQVKWVSKSEIRSMMGDGPGFFFPYCYFDEVIPE